MALTICLWLYLCQVWNNPFTVANANSISWKQRYPKGEEMFCLGLGFEWQCWSLISVLPTALHGHLKIEDLSFGGTSSHFFFFFKTPSVQFLILGAVVSSPGQTGDLKSQVLQRMRSSQPFPLPHAYKIVVVTRLSAFLNVSAVWSYTCAIPLFPAKEKIRNEALGYSELPWERFKISIKHDIIVLIIIKQTNNPTQNIALKF